MSASPTPSKSSQPEKLSSSSDRDEKRVEAVVESPIDKEDVDGELLTPDRRPAAELRLKRKLDMRLMPTMILIYLLNYIDRVAPSAARLQGLEADLGLSDIQYEAILALVYALYCPAQIPSNMALNKLPRPSIFIGTCVVLWGLTSLLTGVTHNFAGIALCRLFIGLPEAAFYPGAVYLISRWYTKKELSLRGAILYFGLLVSNAFGSLIAAGILSNMNGMLGIQAWRWLFYIEGAITMSVGFLAMWSLPDFPHNTRWLSPAERRLAQVRLAEDAGEADEDSLAESFMEGMRMALRDPKTYFLALLSFSQLLGLSFVNFFPTLTATLGFPTTATLLMAAPPWIFAALMCCLNAWHADKTGERFFHVTWWTWGTILGYIIALSTTNVGARYFSLFIMASGYASFALVMVWTSNAIPRPPAKRAAAIGLVNGFGNLGNLVGSFVWKANWGPDYHQSMGIALSSMVFATCMSLIIRWLIIRDNKKLAEAEEKWLHGAERERIEEAARLEGITFEEALEKKKGFRLLY
ncbi:hypothetical protein JAAARDRAFT_60082 [Jaapia argillacea MUCL 33604]|uniref:Major facilitator superfamily (MFS) profile domain-containing protein n=1 Tax=Jaapia argillacea MUCL 33604 TaxID=933084 RepID=A0A067PMT9_9AGAM|nr:hypothetical protein JAAARDRAFT_60082 [Jaapia argillacea MUCL 33604]